MDDLVKNQFVYKREVEVPPVQEDTEKGIVGADGYTKVVYDSFNIDNVLRTRTLDDGSLIVLLDDFHERNQEIPKTNAAGQPVFNRKGKMQTKLVKDTFQSEILLSEKEGKTFLKLTAINKI